MLLGQLFVLSDTKPRFVLLINIIWFKRQVWSARCD